jgi:predicted amidohydrolase
MLMVLSEEQFKYKPSTRPAYLPAPNFLGNGNACIEPGTPAAKLWSIWTKVWGEPSGRNSSAGTHFGFHSARSCVALVSTRQMMNWFKGFMRDLLVTLAVAGLLPGVWGAAEPTTDAGSNSRNANQRPLIRIGTAQPRSRLIDWRLTNATEVLARVDRSLGELEQLVHQAGSAKCDVLALPEDTLGLGHWEAAHKQALQQVLPEAVKRMLDRFGRAAAAQQMYLVCCNDTIDPDGSVHNTAFLLGRDGKEIGRYHKVNMPIHELDRQRGNAFPVFKTADLGGVGMLICYDMVFPEAPRCLALGGADIIFHPTLGGAAIGDDDINRAAFRTRAVENFVYLVISQRFVRLTGRQPTSSISCAV